MTDDPVQDVKEIAEAVTVEKEVIVNNKVTNRLTDETED